MKKTLLILVAAFMATQLASAQYYINEIFVAPPGDDFPNEYIELRGPNGGTFPEGTYLVQIEGDIDNNPGDVESDSPSSSGDNTFSQGGIIPLGGISLGSNGILVIASTGNDYTIDPDAAVLLDVTDGTLEDKSHTFMLINAPVKPESSDDIDSNDDGTPDGDVFASWTIYDSIGFSDDDGGEIVYGQINFVQENPGNTTITLPGSTVVMTSTDEYDYAARINNSNGYTVTDDETTSDWVGGDVNSRNAERTQYEFSSTDGRVIPSFFAGAIVENNIGALNFGQSGDVASSQSFAFTSLSIYPNPATSFLNVVSNGPEAITGAEIFDVLGKRVKALNDWNSNQINVDALNSGVYFLKVYSNDNSITRKIVIQ
ncbi:T9SS type A sorting domain-containing protein [Nonlabens agnitus]|uniref:Secretion system C-terminal sorting domain-containing protein n=1 Tax=Nonlabens agnitus TaxID=870484 RepID=A0A2S9WR00_9FLAO|nr:T9SS type A sorting domain-containing protein [Nonlabens agnitus]PRP65915.1 hypothetical protein BST86_01830 [Nonlabens agnitus]